MNLASLRRAFARSLSWFVHTPARRFKPRPLQLENCLLEERACPADVTPPTVGIIEASEPTDLALLGLWSGFSDDVGIVNYQMAVGTTPGGTEVRGFVNVGNVAGEYAYARDLNLIDGATYYLSVKAFDAAGNESAVATDDVVFVDLPPYFGPVHDGFVTNSDINFQSSKTTLYANWFRPFRQQVYTFEAAVGTTPGGTDIRAFAAVNASEQGYHDVASVTGLNLADGVKYYITVRATEVSGGKTATLSSDGVFVTTSFVEGRYTPSRGGLVVGNLSDIVDGDFSRGQLSLREAVQLFEASPSLDAIMFDPSLSGTIALTGGEIAINKNVMIHSPSAKKLAIDAHGASRIFHVMPEADLSLTGVTLENGVADAGGAVLAQGTFRAFQCVFDSNTATSPAAGGGAISGTGFIGVIDSTFVDNVAAGAGGAIAVDGPSSGMQQSTFVGNRAGKAGGALHFTTNSVSISVVAQCTIVSNVANTLDADLAAAGGGIAIDFPGRVSLHNSIVAGNKSGAALVDDDIAGQVIVPDQSSHNLIGSAASAGGITDGVQFNIVGVSGAGTRALGTIVEVMHGGDARLADNGGATRTVALVRNSPAIGAGLFTLTFDQRNAPRDPGSSDIGAYEVQHPLAPVGVPINDVDQFGPRPNFDTNVAFLKGLYQTTLLRPADSAGLAGWIDVLNAGVSRTDVAYGFVNSVENRTNQVNFFYKYFLGRSPDAEGLATWVGALQRGTDEGTVMSGFLLSPEFTGQNDNNSFVNLMYFALLGRRSDASGFANWTGILDRGEMTRAEVADGFLRSDEGLLRIINSDMLVYLKRTPFPNQAAPLIDHLRSGITFGQYAAELLGSDEFYVLGLRTL